MPYYGYARQDRIAHANEPISARLVADLFSNAGVSRVLTMELHTPQIQGFFSVPLDNLTPSVLFAETLNEIFANENIDTHDVAIVSPDHGAMYRARDVANYVPNSSLVIIDKRRPKPNVAEITNIIGEIENKICVMVDDIIDTGGTILAGAKVLKEKGAKKIYICVSHALFSHNALKKFEEADFVDGVFVTDTIEHPEFYHSSKIKVVSIASMIADVIKSHESHENIKNIYTRFH